MQKFLESLKNCARSKFVAGLVCAAIGIGNAVYWKLPVEMLAGILVGPLAYIGIEGARDIIVAIGNAYSGTAPKP